MPTLKEELRDLQGKKKRFLLLRIADVEQDVARQLCGVSPASYNLWFRQTRDNFVALYRRRDELCTNYKHEAIQMLRRDNQLAAVLLEEKIINKMKDELDTGDYNLIRTNLARDVYTKLIGEIDIHSPSPVLNWNQFVGQLYNNPQLRVEEEHAQIVEAATSLLEQHPESLPIEESEQGDSEVTEEIQA
jgi:hypothetical protein